MILRGTFSSFEKVEPTVSEMFKEGEWGFWKMPQNRGVLHIFASS